MPTPPRTSQVIGVELAELRRYLPELPPHNVAGVRAELLARIGRLEREQHAALAREADEARGRERAAAQDAAQDAGRPSPRSGRGSGRAGATRAE